MRVLFYAKMLKETEIEETRSFVISYYYHWLYFNWGPSSPASISWLHLQFPLSNFLTILLSKNWPGGGELL